VILALRWELWGKRGWAGSGLGLVRWCQAESSSAECPTGLLCKTSQALLLETWSSSTWRHDLFTVIIVVDQSYWRHGLMRLFLWSDSQLSRVQPAWLEQPCSPMAQLLLLVQPENTAAPTPRVSRSHASSPGLSEEQVAQGWSSSVAALKSLPGMGGRQQGRQVPLSAGWMLDAEVYCFSG